MKMDVKNDIKKLLQDHLRTNNVNKEIDSPYAKYNSRGQLMCVVCGVPVKSKIIWQAHVNKRSHKENLVRLKDKQEKINKLQYNEVINKEKKRLQPSSHSVDIPKKSAKLEQPKGILKSFTSYSSSEDESETERGTDSSLNDKDLQVDTTTIKSELPDNFISDKTQNISETQPSPDSQNSKDVKDEKSKSATKDTLPEGFFDDPVADAKARNVEYRDKDAEEWQSFMREVSAAEMESRQIIAEDKEEAAIETQLEQASEQIKCLERIVELDKAKQSQLSEKKNSLTDVRSDESSDEEFLPIIWRTKNSLI